MNEPEAPGRLAVNIAGTEWAIPSWAEVPLPADWRTAECRSCGAPVLWVMTKGGKRAPLDRDGHSHFATCPQADQWRRP